MNPIDTKHLSRSDLHQAGTILTALLVFVAVGLLITTSATILLADQMLAGERDTRTARLLYAAESGAENAILRLLRDPGYTGENITMPDGTEVTISVQLTPAMVITSQSEADQIQRTVQVELVRQNGILEITSWQHVAD